MKRGLSAEGVIILLLVLCVGIPILLSGLGIIGAFFRFLFTAILFIVIVYMVVKRR